MPQPSTLFGRRAAPPPTPTPTATAAGLGVDVSNLTTAENLIDRIAAENAANGSTIFYIGDANDPAIDFTGRTWADEMPVNCHLISYGRTLFKRDPADDAATAQARSMADHFFYLRNKGAVKLEGIVGELRRANNVASPNAAAQFWVHVEDGEFEAVRCITRGRFEHYKIGAGVTRCILDGVSTRWGQYGLATGGCLRRVTSYGPAGPGQVLLTFDAPLPMTLTGSGAPVVVSASPGETYDGVYYPVMYPASNQMIAEASGLAGAAGSAYVSGQSAGGGSWFRCGQNSNRTTDVTLRNSRILEAFSEAVDVNWNTDVCRILDSLLVDAATSSDECVDIGGAANAAEGCDDVIVARCRISTRNPNANGVLVKQWSRNVRILDNTIVRETATPATGFGIGVERGTAIVDGNSITGWSDFISSRDPSAVIFRGVTIVNGAIVGGSGGGGGGSGVAAASIVWGASIPAAVSGSLTGALRSTLLPIPKTYAGTPASLAAATSKTGLADQFGRLRSNFDEVAAQLNAIRAAFIASTAGGAGVTLASQPLPPLTGSAGGVVNGIWDGIASTIAGDPADLAAAVAKTDMTTVAGVIADNIADLQASLNALKISITTATYGGKEIDFAAQLAGTLDGSSTGAANGELVAVATTFATNPAALADAVSKDDSAAVIQAARDAVRSFGNQLAGLRASLAISDAGVNAGQSGGGQSGGGTTPPPPPPPPPGGAGTVAAASIAYTGTIPAAVTGTIGGALRTALLTIPEVFSSATGAPDALTAADAAALFGRIRSNIEEQVKQLNAVRDALPGATAGGVVAAFPAPLPAALTGSAGGVANEIYDAIPSSYAASPSAPADAALRNAVSTNADAVARNIADLADFLAKLKTSVRAMNFNGGLIAFNAALKADLTGLGGETPTGAVENVGVDFTGAAAFSDAVNKASVQSFQLAVRDALTAIDDQIDNLRTALAISDAGQGAAAPPPPPPPPPPTGPTVAASGLVFSGPIPAEMQGTPSGADRTAFLTIPTTYAGTAGALADAVDRGDFGSAMSRLRANLDELAAQFGALRTGLAGATISGAVAAYATPLPAALTGSAGGVVNGAWDGVPSSFTMTPASAGEAVDKTVAGAEAGKLRNNLADLDALAKGIKAALASATFNSATLAFATPLSADLTGSTGGTANAALESMVFPFPTGPATLAGALTKTDAAAIVTSARDAVRSLANQLANIRAALSIPAAGVGAMAPPVTPEPPPPAPPPTPATVNPASIEYAATIPAAVTGDLTGVERTALLAIPTTFANAAATLAAAAAKTDAATQIGRIRNNQAEIAAQLAALRDALDGAAIGADVATFSPALPAAITGDADGTANGVWEGIASSIAATPADLAATLTRADLIAQSVTIANNFADIQANVNALKAALAGARFDGDAIAFPTALTSDLGGSSGGTANGALADVSVTYTNNPAELTAAASKLDVSQLLVAARDNVRSCERMIRNMRNALAIPAEGIAGPAVALADVTFAAGFPAARTGSAGGTVRTALLAIPIAYTTDAGTFAEAVNRTELVAELAKIANNMAELNAVATGFRSSVVTMTAAAGALAFSPALPAAMTGDPGGTADGAFEAIKSAFSNDATNTTNSVAKTVLTTAATAIAQNFDDIAANVAALRAAIDGATFGGSGLTLAAAIGAELTGEAFVGGTNDGALVDVSLDLAGDPADLAAAASKTDAAAVILAARDNIRSLNDRLEALRTALTAA